MTRAAARTAAATLAAATCSRSTNTITIRPMPCVPSSARSTTLPQHYPREQQTPAVPSIPAPSSSGPPPLGSILQLAKESGKSRKECKAALIAHGNDYDAARWSLMPNPNGAAPSQTHCCTDDGHAASAAVPGTFEPAPKFAGGRPGLAVQARPPRRRLLPRRADERRGQAGRLMLVGLRAQGGGSTFPPPAAARWLHVRRVALSYHHTDL